MKRVHDLYLDCTYSSWRACDCNLSGFSRCVNVFNLIKNARRGLLFFVVGINGKRQEFSHFCFNSVLLIYILSGVSPRKYSRFMCGDKDTKRPSVGARVKDYIAACLRRSFCISYTYRD